MIYDSGGIVSHVSLTDLVVSSSPRLRVFPETSGGPGHSGLSVGLSRTKAQ